MSDLPHHPEPNTHEEMMSAALELAAQGVGAVEPNPAVGCLITKAGDIVGQGKHERYGGPHAEVNALTDCRRRGEATQGSTVYVTLEPCCHHGKTGPCVEALIQAKPARVVIAAQDPSAHARGAGIQRLREAGIQVTLGICAAEARRLNAPFYHFVETGRTWVILKWAQSLDGKLAYADRARDHWISGSQSQRDVHLLRRRTQAILVGINTVLHDDPLLTARPPGPRPSLRIVLDPDLRISPRSRLLATARDHPLLIVTRAAVLQATPDRADVLRTHGAECLPVAVDAGERNLTPLLDELSRRGVQQLLVEGGPTTLAAFLKQGLANELCLYVAPIVLGAEGAASLGGALAGQVCRTDLQHIEVKRLGPDLRLRALTMPYP